MEIYTVKLGDTLSKIAERLGIGLTVLLSINPQIDYPNIIFTGQPINIPQIPPTEAPGNRQASQGADIVPPWLEIARQEIGVREYKGPNSNPRIEEYQRTTSLGAGGDGIPWCSAFTNWCILQAGLIGTDSAAAKSWLNWRDGRRVKTPIPGDIVVLHRGNKPWMGHVAFFERENGDGLYLLGGNQGDQVKVSIYSKSRLAGIIRPVA